MPRWGRADVLAAKTCRIIVFKRKGRTVQGIPGDAAREPTPASIVKSNDRS
jgi:hypothetical protein